MTIAIFVTARGARRHAEDLLGRIAEDVPAFLAESAQVRSADVFVPAAGEVATFDQRDAPPLIVQIDVDSAYAAHALVESAGFRQRLLAETAYGVPLDGLALDVLESVNFPVPGHGPPPPRTAPLSFVVRYYGPTEDLAAFDRFYVDNHPPLLARFPEIRNVLCYLPLDRLSAGRVPDDRLILGNEVVFDDVAALNRALASDVLPLLIADGKRFPAFGRNSHHAMHRHPLFPGRTPTTN